MLCNAYDDMAVLVFITPGVLQLHVTRRVDERQVRQPSVGIDLFGALASVIILFSQILFCIQ